MLEMDAGTGSIEHVIEVGSDKAHRIEVLPDGSKLYSENDEVRSVKARERIKKIPPTNGLAGIGMSPDGGTSSTRHPTRSCGLFGCRGTRGPASSSTWHRPKCSAPRRPVWVSKL